MVLITAVLPERAVSVGYRSPAGEVVFPPGTVIGTGPDRIYGLPIEPAPPSAPADVVYLDAEGRELPVPSP